jgi:hypothetical protein
MLLPFLAKAVKTSVTIFDLIEAIKKKSVKWEKYFSLSFVCRKQIKFNGS